MKALIILLSVFLSCSKGIAEVIFQSPDGLTIEEYQQPLSITPILPSTQIKNNPTSILIIRQSGQEPVSLITPSGNTKDKIVVNKSLGIIAIGLQIDRANFMIYLISLSSKRANMVDIKPIETALAGRVEYQDSKFAISPFQLGNFTLENHKLIGTATQDGGQKKITLNFSVDLEQSWPTEGNYFNLDLK